MEISELKQKKEIMISVTRAGVKQKVTFEVTREKTLSGEALMLKVDKIIEMSELLKLVEIYKIPVKSLNALVLPQGKMLKDFVNI